jgi:hypothetical protein
MRRAAVTLAEAQSFDRIAGAYDRLGDLNPNELIDSWLQGLLPAAGGRAALMDTYPPESDLRPRQALRRMLHQLVPLRPRLHALAVQKLGVNLVRRGPATAWEIYRVSTRRQWLDHRVTDRFFSRDELERSCQSLFPGYRFDILGGPRGIGLVWDAPGGGAAWKPDAGNGDAIG